MAGTTTFLLGTEANLEAVRGVALDVWIAWRWKAAERVMMGEDEDLTALADEAAARRRILDMMDVCNSYDESTGTENDRMREMRNEMERGTMSELGLNVRGGEEWSDEGGKEGGGGCEEEEEEEEQEEEKKKERKEERERDDPRSTATLMEDDSAYPCHCMSVCPSSSSSSSLPILLACLHSSRSRPALVRLHPHPTKPCPVHIVRGSYSAELPVGEFAAPSSLVRRVFFFFSTPLAAHFVVVVGPPSCCVSHTPLVRLFNHSIDG